MIKDGKVFAPFSLPDYRVARPTMYVDVPRRTAAAVHRQTIAKVQGREISFLTPNSITMFYNKSYKEYRIGFALYEEVVLSKVKPDCVYHLEGEDLPKLYDYFEHIQTSIVSIYSAIEALSNAAIPEHFTFEKKNARNVTEVWNKENIERWLSTEEKIGKIVPKIIEIDSPMKMPFWNGFKKLKQIRDDIIHQKQSTEKKEDPGSTFLAELLDESIFKTIDAGFQVIQYFCKMDQTHRFFPMLSSEIPFDVNIIDDLYDRYPFLKSRNAQ